MRYNSKLWMLAAAAATLFATGFARGDLMVRKYGAEDSAPDSSSVEVRKIERASSAKVGEQLAAVALLPDFETPEAEWDVGLVRVNGLVGRHRRVYGFDIGLVGGITDDDMCGVAMSGVFNNIGSSAGALQAAGALNHAAWEYAGIQFAIGMNWTEGEMSGVQFALFNVSGKLRGVQVGAVNVVELGTGFQLGLFNRAERLEGFQVGLINVNLDSSVPCLPIVNFAF